MGTGSTTDQLVRMIVRCDGNLISRFVMVDPNYLLMPYEAGVTIRFKRVVKVGP